MSCRFFTDPSQQKSQREHRGSRGPLRWGWSALAVAAVVLAGTPRTAEAQASDSDADEAKEVRELSLGEAVEIAMSNNDEIQGAEASVDQQRASYRSTTAQFGPSLRLESNVTRWDEPQTAEFSAPGQSGGAELTVRDQTTADLSLTLVQPLTPLWSIYESERVQKLNVEEAETAHDRARRDVALQVVEAYFRLLQARAVRDVAEQSVERRKRQLERARKFRRAEQVPKNDVLRAKVGVSRARQRLIESRGNLETASAQLARVMGTRQDRRIAPTTEVDLDYSPPTDVDRAVERAVERRSSVRQAELRAEQASAGVRAARSQLLPQVNALASYQRSYGSTFANEESFFIGANLQWTIWQWGQKNFEVDRATAQHRQAEIGRRRLERGIELEVRNAYTNFETREQSVKVARRAVDQAEENYRAERDRFDAQLSTSIDLLDAETQLTETRSNARNAEYELYIAAANLRRALGLEPWEATGGDEARTEAK